ncbi:MAG: diguanylate cyclase, partial [Actinomycetota bacterium]|nr:diguanylate cyclase [Actinomycetota bacterium]
GHPAGDRALVETAKRIIQCVRPGDTVARLGGDEFAILLHGVDSIEDAESIVDRVVASVAAAHPLPDVAIRLRTSAGLVIAADDETSSDLLANADVAMYASKAAGGDRWTRFREEHRVGLLDRIELKSDLEQAIQSQDLELVYQPIYGTAASELRSVEALSTSCSGPDLTIRVQTDCRRSRPGQCARLERTHRRV